MKYGFITVGTAIPAVRVADIDYNLSEIERLISQAEGRDAEVLVFPELSLTGYTCQDLFRQQTLLDRTEDAVMELMAFTRQLDIIVIVGAPIAVGPLLLNCAVIIQQGDILGIVPKTYLPNYGEFYEKRWFASSQDLHKQLLHYAGQVVTMTPDVQIFRTSTGANFGVEICEDLWAPTPPSNAIALAGADIIFNLSASDELIGKHEYLLSLLSQQSARTIAGYVYSGSGFGESTQDVVYGGNALIYENGRQLAASERFNFQPQLIISQIDVEKLRAERRANSTYVNAQRPTGNAHVVLPPSIAQQGNTKVEGISPRIVTTHGVSHIDSEWRLLRHVNAHPFIPSSVDMKRSCEEIFNIQVAGLAKRIIHTNASSVVVGISGGLDSTLALMVCVRTFDKLQRDRKDIIGVTMPGFGTTDRTYNNAVSLMHDLGITVKEISIADAVSQHFKDIGHDASIHDTTYENSQARERTQILMDLANKLGGLVIGTGDLSELALGWCTYNGDHMSMYAVNVGIPKTLISYLVRYVAASPNLADSESGASDADVARTLIDIIDTPISPELTPADKDGNIAQKTEDLVGPYELHDFFLYYFLRYGFHPEKIFMLAREAFPKPDDEPTAQTKNDIPTGSYNDATIKKWLRTFFRRFFSQQFKRSCLPDGPKVGSVSLSPRGDWRMPSDAVSQLWLSECDNI